MSCCAETRPWSASHQFGRAIAVQPLNSLRSICRVCKAGEALTGKTAQRAKCGGMIDMQISSKRDASSVSTTSEPCKRADRDQAKNAASKPFAAISPSDPANVIPWPRASALPGRCNGVTAVADSRWR